MADFTLYYFAGSYCSNKVSIGDHFFFHSHDKIMFVISFILLFLSTIKTQILSENVLLSTVKAFDIDIKYCSMKHVIFLEIEKTRSEIFFEILSFQISPTGIAYTVWERGPRDATDCRHYVRYRGTERAVVYANQPQRPGTCSQTRWQNHMRVGSHHRIRRQKYVW